jgi:hypothetical protein
VIPVIFVKIFKIFEGFPSERLPNLVKILAKII